MPNPFPLDSSNWTTGALLVDSAAVTTVNSLGQSHLSSISIPGHPRTVPLFTILIPLPAGTTDRNHFQPLSSKLPSTHDQSHLHYREMLENGGEDMFKISACLSVARSWVPEEIKNSLTGGFYRVLARAPTQVWQSPLDFDTHRCFLSSQCLK